MAGTAGLEDLEIVQELGRGAMGVVYEVMAGEGAAPLALKVLLRRTADDVVELKREFRRLRGVQHPNLVQLGRLGVTEHGIGFTMERVHGTDIVTWCEGRDAAAVCGAFGQLAVGLHALHRSGLLHQDVKPSNVMVDRQGRVVLVDFGLCAFVHRDDEDAPSGGTYAYMAPEQAWNRSVGEAADWFAFGGVLFRVLTGENPPRVGMEPADAVRLGMLDEVATDRARLACLCQGLLAETPTERPVFSEVAEALGVKDDLSAWVRMKPDTFRGRDTELALLAGALEAAHQGAFEAISVVGPSGIGKSALLEAFLERQGPGPGTLILQARCHPQDVVGFNGADELVDDLAEFLERLPEVERAQLDEADVTLVADVFTGFRRLLSSEIERQPMSARTVERAAGALRRVIEWVTTRRTVFVTIDDVQWADADSLSLLRQVFRPGLRNVVIVLSARAEVPALEEWCRRVGADVVALASLPDDVVLSMLQGRVQDQQVIQRILETANGSPFAVTELARYVSADGVEFSGAGDFILDAIRWRVQAHGPDTAAVLGHVALCGAPAPVKTLMAAGLADVPLLQRLADQCFIQMDARGDTVRAYHDTVGQAVLSELSDAARRPMHKTLADALQGTPSADPALISEHYERAGELTQAFAFARDAAIAASRRGAFESAAHQYERAHALSPSPDALLAAHTAEAWASAGRSEPAARWFATARSQTTQSSTALDWHRLEAEHYLRAGDVERGTGAFRAVFAALSSRFPSSTFEALVRLLYGRARLALSGRAFTLELEEPISARDRTRLDAMYSAGLGLNMIDLLTSAMLATEYSRAALALGDPDRVARALSIETSYLANAGGNAKRRASEHIAERLQQVLPLVNDATTLALVALNEGTTDYFCGRWAASVDALSRASAAFSPHYDGLNWELGSCQLYRLWALTYLGDFERVVREAPRLSEQALRRGDRMFSVALASGHCNMAWLVMDQPHEARRLAVRAIEAFSPTSFQSPEYFDIIAQCHIDLYEGNGVAAHERVVPMFKRMKRAQFLRPQFFRVEMLFLRARCAAAAAGQDPRRRDALLSYARADARRLRREDIAFATPMADLIDAVVRCNAGEDADTDLLVAADALDGVGMGGFAKLARWQTEQPETDEAVDPGRLSRLTGVCR